MRVFNYSEARQPFASLLNMALKEDFIIKKRMEVDSKLYQFQTQT